MPVVIRPLLSSVMRAHVMSDHVQLPHHLSQLQGLVLGQLAGVSLQDEEESLRGDSPLAVRRGAEQRQNREEEPHLEGGAWFFLKI